MPTLTATRPHTAAETAHPDVSRPTLLVGTTTIADVRALHTLPALGPDEFAAVLRSASPGVPVAVVGRRDGTCAYDQIVVVYCADGVTERQTWARVADLGAEVTYELAEDTGARGGFVALRR
ncbi:hypothetical protein ACNHYB_08490 [Isoptericola jiangsuensis]|uniref:hypothetical protein n=1 Tax=Isoptericola jiangsuensis TaxID=548579 RepID=UPI003AAE656E